MIIGIVSIFDESFWGYPGFGFVMSIAPLVGLILGICGATKEKQARGFSITGIIVNSLMLFGGLIAGLIAILVMGALVAL